MGADWAGYNDEQDAYEWDPVTVVPGLVEADVLGLEAPLWTLVLRSVADMDYLAFPRLARPRRDRLVPPGRQAAGTNTGPASPPTARA